MSYIMSAIIVNSTILSNLTTPNPLMVNQTLNPVNVGNESAIDEIVRSVFEGEYKLLANISSRGNISVNSSDTTSDNQTQSRSTPTTTTTTTTTLKHGREYIKTDYDFDLADR